MNECIKLTLNEVQSHTLLALFIFDGSQRGISFDDDGGSVSKEVSKQHKKKNKK